MDEHEWLVEQFEGYRTHLRAVAYRMLGSLSEADDAVQESWLRLSRSDKSDVENLGGWLTTVVARVCLDMLRSRESRHEESLDAHVADPIVSHAEGIDPEHEALLADSVRTRPAAAIVQRRSPSAMSPGVLPSMRRPTPSIPPTLTERVQAACQ
jgi:DNA-directed RNA polymerase specialized sigma24 family protein